jgi:hypothetical protein
MIITAQTAGKKAGSIMADKWVKRWMVKSGSTEGFYTVAQDKDGQYACSCPGWTRHTPRTDCKHVMAVKNFVAGNSWVKDTVFTFEQGIIGRMLGTLKGDRL